VAQQNGKFTPRNVNLGLSLNDGKVQVLSGVASGDLVVTSGQFLLDSESKLKEAVQKMMEAQKPSSTRKKKDQADNFFDDMEAENDDFFNDMEEE
jgi:Cu(I)/Ag(I) efflux system membrane fusion protein/cobalt-zinc-cadmium efflux system membrane fusion protein